MRYIKVVYLFIDKDEEMYETDLRLNPFSIESFHAGVMDYYGEDGVPMSRDTTCVYSKSGKTYNLSIPIEDFEKLYDNYMKQ